MGDQMAKVNKCEVSKYNTKDLESINLQIELNGQVIEVSIQAVDGKLRVLAGSASYLPASLTFPSNMSIDNFEYPSD